MFVLDLTFPTPAENLACDEALLDACEDGLDAEILRFWESREPFVVLGYSNHAAREANLPACDADRISVLRRCSGGGAVLQGPGCLNYTLILRITENGPLATITGANQFIMRENWNALAPLLEGDVSVRGTTDLALGQLKFSGNAQRRRRKFLIFHGTFLLNFNLGLIEKYLRMPSKQPGYRQDRSHHDFLTNLNFPADTLKHALANQWSANQPLEKIPRDKITDLVRAKYSTRDWNFKFQTI